MYKDGTYVISDKGGWIPGVYQDIRTAKYAFKFPHSELSNLQSIENVTSGIITFEDLQELRKQLKENVLQQKDN
jgi:hypothetical protein